MTEICDLHTHSVFSDGTWTPAELIDGAERIGLAAIALCDHNTVAGVPDFLTAARGRQVEAIAGIEFSTGWRDRELHILALFLRPEHFAPISDLMEHGAKLKEQSNIALVDALAQAGYPLDYAAICAATPDGKINRAHIAAELTRQGYTSSIQEAFDRLLSPKRGLYNPPPRPDAREIIRYIRSIGAVSVLAHPLVSLTEAELLDFLGENSSVLPDAMEVLYSTYDLKTQETAIRIADRFGLKYSGGSDFHGENKPDIRLGSGKGNLTVPLALLKDLRSSRP